MQTFIVLVIIFQLTFVRSNIRFFLIVLILYIGLQSTLFFKQNNINTLLLAVLCST